MTEYDEYVSELREKNKGFDSTDIFQYDPIGNYYDAVIEEEYSRLGIEWDIFGPAGRYGEY